jgi:hypothetical protein
MSEKYCFSYIRYSSANQVGNTSVDRQSEVAPRVAAQRGWKLRTDLCVLQEKTSAYKGLNVPMIRRIIQDVESGVIPQGTVMIVEKFNRAFRQKLEDSVPLLWEMLKSGLELYIDQTDRYLTRKSLADENMEMTIAIQELKTAFKHSNDLSDQVRKAFKIKKQAIEDGTSKGFSRKHLPGWITADGNMDARARFTITGYHFNDKAETVASICNDYLASVGAYEIARRLNTQNAPTLVDGMRKGKKRNWGQSVIYRLLSNYQLIGNQRVDGKGKADFYPPVISEETFLKIQSKLNDNKEKHGFSARNETMKNSPFINNVFSGVAFCTCERGIKVERNLKAYKYIGCHGRKAGLCNVKNSPRLELLEDSFVSLLRNNPEQLIQDENSNQTAHNIEVLRGRKLETEKQIANITEALTVKFNKALVLRQSELETTVENLDAQITLESAQGVSVKGGLEAVTKIVAKLDAFGTDNVFRAEVAGWIRQTRRENHR